MDLWFVVAEYFDRVAALGVWDAALDLPELSMLYAQDAHAIDWDAAVGHLPARAADVVPERVLRHAGRTILFSAAEPGQPGHGHVNCRPLAYWLDRFAALGCYPETANTLGLRCLATLAWFRRNLVVFRRTDPRAGTEASAVLNTISARPFSWYGQAPGIRDFPFTKELAGTGAVG